MSSYYFVYAAEPGTPAGGIAEAKQISQGARTTSADGYIKVVVDESRWMDLHDVHPASLRLIEFGPGDGDEGEHNDANGFGAVKGRAAT